MGLREQISDYSTRPMEACKNWLSVYAALGKAALSLLVAATAAAGFVLPSSSVAGARLFWVFGGTFLAAMGANGLNQWLEWKRDRAMSRTAARPLPVGRIGLGHALACSIGLAALGDAMLLAAGNRLSFSLALAAQAIYLFCYTPLKTRTSLCTLAGALSGAIPPLIGWSAATGGIHYGALILSGTLFLWQVPHFLALAWVYRCDYENGGFLMLPVTDPSGRLTCQVIVLYTLALIPFCLLASLAGVAGGIYAGGSLLLGLCFFRLGWLLYRDRRERDARRLFFGSILYLPILLLLMVADGGEARFPEQRLRPSECGIAAGLAAEPGSAGGGGFSGNM